MPRIRFTIGNGDQMEASIIEATPLGLLGPEAVVRIGQAEIRGNAKAMRRLANATCEAAHLAEAREREREGSRWPLRRPSGPNRASSGTA